MNEAQKTRLKISPKDTLLNTMAKAGHEIVQKPVIASLAGTTKALSLSLRPQRPIKPISEKNLSVDDSYKLKKTSRTCAHQFTFYKGQGLLKLDSSEQKAHEGGMDSEICREACRHQTLTGSSGSSTMKSVKSTPELLKEAQLIAGLEQPDESDHQRAQDETLADTSVKESGHIRDDDSTGQLQKEVSTCNEITKQVPNQCDSTVPQLHVCVAEERYSRPMCPLPMPTGVCKMTMSGLQGIRQVDCDDEVEDLLSPVTNEDIIMARGHSLIQRAERTSHQTKTIQGLSLLATWTPKKDSRSAERYKTIHHLCTTSASQIVPVELQFASRFCHTQNLVTVTAHVDQQMAAPGQLSHPDIKRLVCEGVSAKSAEVSSHTDCISHLPKQLSDTLEDWKRIAEFYVERPRITMCGRAATLCASELRMFWNPVPPKFICAPCVMKEKLFPEYQVTRPDQYKENLLDDVVESVPEQATVSFSKSKSLSHLRTTKLALFSPSTAKEQARRPHSAPHLTPDPEPLLQLRSDFNSLSQELEHVRLQKKSVCVPLAGEFPPSARRQIEPKDVHTGPDSSEETCQIPNHRKSPRKRTDRANVSRFKRRPAKTKRKFVTVKMAYVQKKLSEPPRTLKRSESMCQLPWNPKPSESLSSPLNSLSLPLLLDFESFSADRGGIPDTTPPREWVRDLWDVWFDELFPPLEKVQSTVSVSGGLEENQTLHDNIQELDIVDLSEVLDEGLTTDDVEQEVAKLTQVMSERGNHRAFDLTRRGALQIKLGHLNLALEDLNAVRHFFKPVWASTLQNPGS